MKGVVFTEFMEMVDVTFGMEITEKIIEKSGVKGVYTSIGTYPHSEMVQLVSSLAEETKIGIPSLLESFGAYLFSSFARIYPEFFSSVKDPLAFLENVESYIHQEVRKIYPQAELPEIKTKRINETALEMIYSSDRRMSDLAVGLIKGCLTHYKRAGSIRELNSAEGGKHVTFLVELNHG